MAVFVGVPISYPKVLSIKNPSTNNFLLSIILFVNLLENILAKIWLAKHAWFLFHN